MYKEKSSISVGVDIGGSHLSACLVNMHNNTIIKNSYRECLIDAKQPALKILNDWCSLIKDTIQTHINSIGIAMPGPFDYNNGISKILNLGKYDQLFGVNVKLYFASALNMQPNQIHFINDAAAFALGEFQKEPKYKSILALTLGTGFGSTYINEGIPLNKMLYNIPFKESIANDYFSTKWLINRYNFKHSDKDWHRERVRRVKAIGKDLSKNIARCQASV